MKSKPHTETILTHHGEDRSRYEGAVVPPIFQNSLFTFESWDAIEKAFDDPVENAIYSRGTNPTVRMVQEKLAAMAGAGGARLFSSGMAAITAAILFHVSAGDHVIVVRNVYGPTNNLLNRYLGPKLNLEVTFVSGETVEEFEAAIRPETSLIFLESPSSVVFSLQDLAGVAGLARNRGIATIIDNSWATPLFQCPLDLGIDMELHTCSKYLAGHSDLIAGLVLGSAEDIRKLSANEAELLGGTMAPFEAWLLMRSLRTLPMRLEKHQENALAVAHFLEQHPRVKRVRHPGLPSHPQYQLARKQMNGTSGLMGFRLDTDELPEIKRFFDGLELFLIGVSWGGHESLIYAPAISYLKELPPDQFDQLGITRGDMRISVGLENAEDLIADLAQALDKM
jgi:cystathionine beta-lyase